MKSCCDKLKELVKCLKPNIKKAVILTAKIITEKIETELEKYDIGKDIKELIKDSAEALINGGTKIVQEDLDNFTKAHIKNSMMLASIRPVNSNGSNIDNQDYSEHNTPVKVELAGLNHNDIEIE